MKPNFLWLLCQVARLLAVQEELRLCCGFPWLKSVWKVCLESTLGRGFGKEVM